MKITLNQGWQPSANHGCVAKPSYRTDQKIITKNFQAAIENFAYSVFTLESMLKQVMFL